MRSSRVIRLFRVVAGCLALLMLVLAPVDADARRRGRKKKAPKPAAPPKGSVVIMSITEGATIVIDGKEIGLVPMDDPIPLNVGQHLITMSKRGWSEYNDTFTITADEETELEIDLIPSSGFLKLTTERAGATIKVNDKVVGVTPFDSDVPVGKVAVTVTRPGYADHKLPLDVMPGKNYEFNVKLKMLERPSDSVLTKWWFWTVVGVAVAGGATAAVLLSEGEVTTIQPHHKLAIE